MEKVSEFKLNEMTFHESIDNQFNPPIARYLDYEVIYNKIENLLLAAYIINIYHSILYFHSDLSPVFLNPIGYKTKKV